MKVSGVKTSKKVKVFINIF